MVKKTKFLPQIGIVKTEQLAEKIESDANDIREKYPEIAKMTVSEVVATNLFTIGLRQAIRSYEISLEKNIVAHKRTDYYAFRSLEKCKTLEPENFRKEYIACMDKESNLPTTKRIIVLTIGNDAYRRTVKQMMDNYDAIKSEEENTNKLSL